jgi:GrpB-like predicted nucleotidyltransferase (UPF0157 family)
MVHEHIVIVPHDPSWKEEFARESGRVLAALGALAIRAEHVGSTAIPGLSAKPIVDIMIGVASLTLARQSTGQMASLGYEYVPAFEALLPERLFFQRGSPRTHHVHVAETASRFWTRQIGFRDYLTGHPDVAAEYADLKTKLAARFAEDRDGYTRAKTDFVQAVLAKAGVP